MVSYKPNGSADGDKAHDDYEYQVIYLDENDDRQSSEDHMSGGSDVDSAHNADDMAFSNQGR